MDEADLHNRFSFHPADTLKTQELHREVRHQCYTLALRLNDLLLEGREKSLAITHLEEVMFWSNSSIAREPKQTAREPNKQKQE